MIIYKSKYSLVCRLVGHPLPKTQEEENYCQLVELDNDSTWPNVLHKMLNPFMEELKDRMSGKNKNHWFVEWFKKLK